jgi:aminopeptidase N
VTGSPIDHYGRVVDSGGDHALRSWAPVSQDEVIAMHRLSTSKGASTLLMLSDIIGRDAVIHGLRSLFPKSGGGAAAWRDVEQAISRTADQDLEWFFGQWLGRPGWRSWRCAGPPRRTKRKLRA